MGLTLLVSSLNKDVNKMIEDMHLDSDAIIVNQCDTDSLEEREYNSHKVKVICSKSRGVGVNRNMCIDEAYGDYVLFCDDDIVYDDGYEKKVVDEFTSHPEADMIMFNFNVCEERRTYYNTEYRKLGRYNIGRYPAYSIAVKTDVLKEKGLKYSKLLCMLHPFFLEVRLQVSPPGFRDLMKSFSLTEESSLPFYMARAHGFGGLDSSLLRKICLRVR